MRDLAVFDRVPIPSDYAATQTYAVLAKRGGGKTYTTLLLEEQMCDAGLFFVVLDPVGKHWALRAGPDGKSKGGKPDVWVLGGAHGDVPLDPKSGELIADVVVDHPGRYVVDVSSFDTDADQDRFALAFAKRLFRRKAKDPGWPMLLILEEAESFIPERPQPGQAPMLGAFGRIMRQGRNHGLGMWMVAQRAQALNKGVLSQAEVLVAKQMAHKRDRDAVEDWIKANGTLEQREMLMSSLASLRPDEAWVWSPSWLNVFERCKVMRRKTFDSSASVKSGQRMRSVELTPLDVEALGEKIEAMRERAQEGDPRRKDQRIRELEREIAKLKAQSSTEVKTVEVPLLSAEDRELLVTTPEQIERAVESIGKLGEAMRAVIQRMVDRLADIDKSRPLAPAPVQRAGGFVPRSRPAGTYRAPASSPSSSNGSLPPAKRKLLDNLASLEQIGVTLADKSQLALFAKVSPTSGGYFNNLSALRSAGYIDYPQPGKVCLTDLGRSEAEWTGAPLTTADLQERIRSVIPPARWRIVEALIEIYPDAIEKSELAERIGVSPTSGGYFNNLSALKTLGLIDYPGRGLAAASEILFMEGR